jgi:hypothetical protein
MLHKTQLRIFYHFSLLGTPQFSREDPRPIPQTPAPPPVRRHGMIHTEETRLEKRKMRAFQHYQAPRAGRLLLTVRDQSGSNGRIPFQHEYP